MRVLVAEDFEVLAEAIGTGLRREGMAVDIVLEGTPHPSVLAGVRLAIGIWLVVPSVLLFSIGDWWAAPMLVVAAALFTAIFYVLRIVQGQPADPSAAVRDGTTQTM